jgi:MFS family permease
LIVGMIAYAFFGKSPIFLDDLLAIIATRIGVGVCEAIIMTVTTTLICDYFSGPAREKWLASQTAVASLSALVLIFVGGLLGSALSGMMVTLIGEHVGGAVPRGSSPAPWGERFAEYQRNRRYSHPRRIDVEDSSYRYHSFEVLSIVP